MSYLIKEECIKCGGCANECPTRAISEGKETYVVDPARCTECLGTGGPAACAAICPVKAVTPDPARRETPEQLKAKHDALDGGGLAEANREAEAEIIAFLDKYSTRPGGDHIPGCGLAHGGACALGTCANGKPRVTPVDYENEGLTLWILGDPGGKCANLCANPEVAVGIYSPMDHTIEHRSLQLWGRATFFTRAGHEEFYMKNMEKLGHLAAARRSIKNKKMALPGSPEMEALVDKIFDREILIRIEPYRAVMLVQPPSGTGRPRRVKWRKTG